MKILKKLLLQKKHLSTLLLGISLLSTNQHLLSHGTVTYPPSRIWVCYNEIVANTNTPTSEGCIAAVMANGGTENFYNFSEVARMDSADDHLAVIPDGNLSSAGRPDTYGGLDLVNGLWETTAVSPGPFTLTWTNNAPHQTLYYRVYITKEGFNPATDVLTWDSLELLVETEPRSASTIDDVDFVLPQRTGKHILFSIWQRPLNISKEAFYATCDVDFGDGIVEPVAPEAVFTFDNGICGGPEVIFDASSSLDGNGDALTYTWDFGDGTSAEGVEVTHVFEDGFDSSMITLTVSDGQFSTGYTETIDLVEDINCSALVCAYDAPRESALPAVNYVYESFYVIGDRGPDLSNVTKFTINWDGNGLYQFDFNLDVSPHYTSLVNSTQNFNQSSPEISLSGSGIEGLDGDYYVTLDEGSFVLVAITGGYTIYFSQTEEAPECDDDIPINTDDLSGGLVLTEGSAGVTFNDSFRFQVDDGTADYVNGLTVEGSIGDGFSWLVTDQLGIVIGFPGDIDSFNFDTISRGEDGEERLFIYNLSYNGSISGLITGASLTELSGEYELSNAIEVYVSAEEIPVVENPCTFDTPRENALPELYYRSYNRDFNGSITVIGTNGPDLSTWRKLDLAYVSGSIERFYFDEWQEFGGGAVELAGNITSHTFDEANPEFTLSGTGIEGLDGSYYVNIAENEAGADFQDFVMVSKTGGFSIYFTYSEEAPDCDIDAGTEENVVYDESVDGDLSSDNSTPTVISLASGNNTVISSQNGTDDIANFFTFQVPEGYVLSQLIVDNYEGDDDIAFIGIEEGSDMDFNAPNAPVTLLGGLSYGTSNIGSDILPEMGDLSNPAAAFVNGFGFTPPLEAGQYTVWLNQTGGSSTTTLNFVVSDEDDGTLSLIDNEIITVNKLQNFPNPFTANTTIEYVLNTNAKVNVEIFNLTGQLVKSLKVGEQASGNHKITFDLNGFSNGIYLYVLTTDKGTQLSRMMIKQ